jgi:hypothetical protein
VETDILATRFSVYREGVMDDMAAVNNFQEVTVPRVVREVLDEEGWPFQFWIDERMSTYLSINFQGRRPIQIPRIWEVEQYLTLKYWIGALIQATLVNTRRARTSS